MAFAFDSKFDVSSLDELKRRLGRCPKEAANAVRKSNRSFAAKLRTFIRNAAPRGSGAKYGPKHTTPRGALRRTVRSGASADSAYVKGGGAGAPHFIVNEFGGGVRWTNGRRSHGIPIKPRKADGYFFFPQAREHADDIAREATEAAMDALRLALASI